MPVLDLDPHLGRQTGGADRREGVLQLLAAERAPVRTGEDGDNLVHLLGAPPVLRPVISQPRTRPDGDQHRPARLLLRWAKSDADSTRVEALRSVAEGIGPNLVLGRQPAEPERAGRSHVKSIETVPPTRRQNLPIKPVNEPRTRLVEGLASRTTHRAPLSHAGAG